MEEIPDKHKRWPLIRQVIVFQLKLGLDALRDVLMSPVSIMLALADIVLANTHQQSYFLRLMRLGRKSDHWINLFGVNLPKEKPEVSDFAGENNVDYWFTKVEAVIKEQHADGKLSQSGKEKLNKYLEKINQSSDSSVSKD
jgi:hypothetical protein